VNSKSYAVVFTKRISFSINDSRIFKG